MKEPLLRMLLSSFGVAVFIYVYLQPTAQPSPITSLALIVGIQFFAFYGTKALNLGTRASQVFRIFILSGLTAMMILFFLRPSQPLSFDATFLGLAAIETSAFILTKMMVRRRS